MPKALFQPSIPGQFADPIQWNDIQHVGSLLKTEEQLAKQQVPYMFQSVFNKLPKPTNIFNDYAHTGDPMLKQAAGQALSTMQNAAQSFLSGPAERLQSVKESFTQGTPAPFLQSLNKQFAEQEQIGTDKQGNPMMVPKIANTVAMGLGTDMMVGSKVSHPIFQGFKDLSTTLLSKLEGKGTVSKQFISDLTNQPELKQSEKELARNILQNEPDKVNVQDFADKVHDSLLPLTRDKPFGAGNKTLYQNITLPFELRGNVSNYNEHVYNSPIKTSAGDVHFNSNDSPNYFAHTRVEDLPTEGHYTDWSTGKAIKGKPVPSEPIRRILEVQSDLFQKGRLEQHAPGTQYANPDYENNTETSVPMMTPKQYSQLEPYRNTWHERIIREEVKQAAVDGKTKLQFPTGETAMKIEGLGYQKMWREIYHDGNYNITNGSTNLTPDKLEVGKMILERGADTGEKWIITDVLGDGKFKAIPRDTLKRYTGDQARRDIKPGELKLDLSPENLKEASKYSETFDISGKVDQNNPIYKFYEKEVGKYLKNKYNAKLITDPQGVTWWEVGVKPEMKNKPILAYGAGLGLASIFGNQDNNKDSDPLYYKRPEPFENGSSINLKDRNVSITKRDMEAAKPIIFAEVSNRSPDKQMLETKTILNTAINRMQQYQERGINMTLKQVLEQPNQYQGFNSNEYRKYKGNGLFLDERKKKRINEMVDSVADSMNSGTFTDNINGYVYYKHSPDGSIHTLPGKLFK